MSETTYGPHSEDVVYAVAKALHKAGYGEDVVEMREAAQAALDAAHDLALGLDRSVVARPYVEVVRRFAAYLIRLDRAEGIVSHDMRRLAEEWADAS
jgi:hypothetical protein